MGLSQLDVEQMFSKEAMRKQFKEELKDFMGCIGKEHYIALHNAMDNGNDKQFTVDVMIDLISALGNPKLGVDISKDSSVKRQIEIHFLVSVIAGLNSIVNRYDTIHRFKVACEIVEEMDTILFDVIQSKRNDTELGWITETNAIIEFNVGENALKLDGLNRYKYPFIEQPEKWHNINNRSVGGYHSDELKEKVTSNKGSALQPDNCLDVLNQLQANVFTLRDIDMDEEYEFTKKQMAKKAITTLQKKDLDRNVDIRLMTCYDTYSFVADKDFYFQWKFDFRGRMYSSGYDVNLQSDKFKKACIKPKMLSSIRRKQLELELRELQCQ